MTEVSSPVSPARSPLEERVAVFGGSFNPPHVGHVLASVYVLSTAPVDHLVVVPVHLHPFAKDLAPYEDRFEMCLRAFGWIPHVTVSRIERDLGGDSFTLRTLQQLAAAHPRWRMRLVMGTDVVGEVEKWHRFEDVKSLAPPLVIPRSRAGEVLQEAALPDVSSTRVRTLLATGAHEEVAAMVPSRVLAYVVERGLYGPEAPSL